MRRLLLAGISSLALATITAPTGAVASPPATVIIESFSNLDPFVTATWSATGAFEDSGTSVFDSFIVTGFGGSGTITVHSLKTNEGEGGTFFSRLEDRAVSVDGPILTLEGHWVIIPGTGTYNSLHGRGTSVTVVNFITGDVANRLWGQVHFE